MSDTYNNSDSPMAKDIKVKANRIAELQAEVERLNKLYAIVLEENEAVDKELRELTAEVERLRAIVKSVASDQNAAAVKAALWTCWSTASKEFLGKEGGPR